MAQALSNTAVADALEEFARQLAPMVREIDAIYRSASKRVQSAFDIDPLLSVLDASELQKLASRLRSREFVEAE